ncbi:arsenate reductase family protein [Anaerostipes sp.]|uniref:arsenate reductase family protein n=1 Tax=Anaerostipes sp. TaxID=1872530 RepID=UPI0025C6276E|nr:arsenate reductase family protein [Anaerostipes sp.]MBS7009957.1 arsenate reductase family protein [Anaerostipes sp.]
MLFIEYPKCTTCRKAKKWLDEHQISYEDRHIVEDNPKAEELKEWIAKSGYPIKRFFNTSGMKYRDLGLKDKLPQMSEEEQIELLSTDGMLVKRPLVIGDDFVLVGFKEEQWGNTIK